MRGNIEDKPVITRATVVNGIDLARHEGLVRLIAHRYWRLMGKRPRAGLEFADLVAVGLAGLYEGARRFDHSLGLAESTYLLHWVRHHVAREWQDRCRTVRIPVHLQEKVRQGQRPESDLRQSVYSLDAPVSDEPNAGEAHEHFADPEGANPEDAIIARLDGEDAHDALQAAIEALPERLRAIIRGRLDGRTLLDIGSELDGLSRERVRQLEADALEAIREELRGDPLRARAMYRRLSESEARSAAQRAA